MPFINFSCLNELAMASSMTMTGKIEGQHPCPLPNLREKAFNITA